AEDDQRLALDLVGDTDGGGLRDGGMRDRGRLDLGRPEPLARDLDRVVRAAVDVPETVGGDLGPVAVDPGALQPRPIRPEAPLALPPEASRHPRPGLADHQLT